MPAPLAMLLLQDAGGAEPAGPDPMVLILGVGIIFLLFVILPERKNRKKREELLGAVKKNDKILTHAGFYATVAAVHETELVVKFDDGPTRVRMLKSSVANVITKDDEAD